MNIKAFLIALSIITSTLFSNAQENDKICLTIPEMDYFIYQDLSQKHLVSDTTEYLKIIRTKNNQISLYKANEYDLKEQVRVQKMLADNYKDAAVKFQDKYTQAQDKVNRRGKIIIGSISVNLVFIAGLIVLLK